MTHATLVYQAVREINTSRPNEKTFANLNEISQLTGLDFDQVTEALNQLYQSKAIEAQSIQTSTGRDSYGYITTFADILAV